MTQVDIFISHSSHDSDIAEGLVNLIRSAINIPANKIRCTSLDGYRLPAGAPTEDQLRQDVLGAKVFIGLITPNSLHSTFVLFELGARWGAGLQLVPLLALGTKADDLQRPLSLLNALNCNFPAQLYQLVDDISVSIGLKADSPASYQKQIDLLAKKSKNKLFEVRQWIATDKKGIKIGLSSPVDKLIVHETPIKAHGQVAGLQNLESEYKIQGFVITNKEYAQDTGIINEEGFWMIQQIHLGGSSHIVFFRIYDNSGKCIAESEKITLVKETVVS